MKYLERLNPSSEFVSLDVETTGRSGRLDVLAEIGAIRYRDGMEVERFVTLVKPGMPMIPWIVRLTGITDAMLAKAPSPSHVARRLLKFLGRTPLVVHNAAFDVPIVETFITRHALGDSNGTKRNWRRPPILCTLRLSRQLLPFLHSRRLHALAEYFDFTPSREHRARFHRAATDAEAAAHVFFCLSAMGGVRR